MRKEHHTSRRLCRKSGVKITAAGITATGIVAAATVAARIATARIATAGITAARITAARITAARITAAGIVAAAIVAAAIATAPEATQAEDLRVVQEQATETFDQPRVRFATFNVSLYGKRAGEVEERLKTGNDRQANQLAKIIQSVRPDVLLINEIDYDEDGKLLDRFADQYLAVANQNLEPIEYRYRYSVPTNTGLSSDHDIDGDAKINLPNDAWGFGLYEGQYAMAVLSRYEIDRDSIRSFQKFRWSEMPAAMKPVDPKTGENHYSDRVWNLLRLSSKNHVDVPIRIGDHTIHLLASHPTPPVFDGAEDRNGCRNHDEIRFWSDYVDKTTPDYHVDDVGKQGGLSSDQSFVIAGDLNSDPQQGDSRQSGITRLLGLSTLTDPEPKQGMFDRDGRFAETQPPASTTAAFGKNGGMRVDYVLPSRSLRVVDSGVFWPASTSGAASWLSASDHRLVWIDVLMP
ncbi:Endonuclease/Exonuclease/phosphatase family protein [Novipirellula aureliae]|uniref:Endonuclease/Exonuclease/phosphatase family protein n=1 Tax=Novipirellula aureliae TaxID=2527966 RepID=A0A5C6DUI1_9BACT|nr:endonuclease/exonuclease/phosphatase family protein [Novipirellula aureliae]TWU40362.1 Endonuclease/Exonuclease/phosphatase family protein [Novipirellula aureliae]